MTFGREQAALPEFGALKKLYISLLGFPAVGLQMRGRRLLPVITREAQKLLATREGQGQAQALKICDAGCGRGSLSFAIARALPDAQVTGLEYEAELVKNCQSIAAARSIAHCAFHTWDITRTLPAGPFDLLVNIETLEHIEDHTTAAANLYAAVAPGGTLICHVPTWHSRMFGTERENIAVPGHVRSGYRHEELIALLEGAGFQVLEWHTTYGSLETLCQRLSFLITGAAMKRAGLYALLYPFLRVVAWVGGCFPMGKKGTNLLAIAKRKVDMPGA